MLLQNFSFFLLELNTRNVEENELFTQLVSVNVIACQDCVRVRSTLVDDDCHKTCLPSALLIALSSQLILSVCTRSKKILQSVT